MKELTYNIDVKAPKSVVRNKMISPETYSIWTRAFSENSFYEGEWKEGSEIKFISPGRGGTVALIEQMKPFEEIRAKHVAVIDASNKVNRSSEQFANWIGTREDYFLSESAGVTTLKVSMKAHPEYASMFEDSWPQALQELKRLAEQS